MLCEKCDLAECTCWCAGCGCEPSTCVCGMKPKEFVTTEEKKTKLAYDAEDLEHIDLLRKKTLELRKMICLYIILGDGMQTVPFGKEGIELNKKYNAVYENISLLSTEIKAIIGTHFL